MIDFKSKAHYTYADLLALVRFLRSEQGCPWDRVQTHASIRRNFLEETFEACEAMDDGDAAHLREELGDVLLQVIFHADIERDAGTFSMDDVCDGICKKLVARHPHLFGNESTPPDWETLKRSQRGGQSVSEAMQGVCKTLPALWRADKILSKAEKAGFCRNDTDQSVAKLKEEFTALETAVRENTDARETLGQLLLAAVSVARSLDADPEQLLNNSCKQFADTFDVMQTGSPDTGRTAAADTGRATTV